MHIWENENISISVDQKDKTTTLETNNGGLMASFVTLHLNETELEALLRALQDAKAILKS